MICRRDLKNWSGGQGRSTFNGKGEQECCRLCVPGCGEEPGDDGLSRIHEESQVVEKKKRSGARRVCGASWMNE
jgi:hypothetical protein